MHAKRIRLGAGVAGALLLVLSSQPAAAQSTPSAIQPGSTPDVIHACYVPNTGTVYRIKEPGLPQQCSGPQQGPNQHVEFSWNQEGPPGAPGTTDHSQLSNLDQDDHPQYLLTEGVRFSPTGFAVIGLFSGPDRLPIGGPGVRLMWVPQMAAFRVGQVTDAHWNLANIGTRSVAMGYNTTASGSYSMATGVGTTASGNFASTAMGINTTASGRTATAMGSHTRASGDFSTALGWSTTASGNSSTALGVRTRASGSNSTAMGRRTTASGDFSTAMGQEASTNNRTGAFVYGDVSTPNMINATADNQFVVRAQRIWLGTNNNVSATAGRFLETSTGGYLSSGGSWVNSSSRLAKENFRAVAAEEVLRKVADLEVPSWNYKAEEASVRHVGPLAQDFYRAFGLGGSDEAISTVDLGGINMLAIQALEGRTTELREENAALRRQNEELGRRLTEAEARNEALERRLVRIETVLQR